LKAPHFDVDGSRAFCNGALDLAERDRPVGFWIPAAESIQIGSMDEQYPHHLWPSRLPKLGGLRYHAAKGRQSSQRDMRYVSLGQSGLRVSRVGLGCMSFGSPEWRDWVLTEEQSRPILWRAFDAGINFFDTADVYSDGLSEDILG